MIGVLRIFPLLAPFVVRITTGSPCSVVPSVPPELSYSSTCLRTNSVALGSYSPVNGISAPRVSGHRRHGTHRYNAGGRFQPHRTEAAPEPVLTPGSARRACALPGAPARRAGVFRGALPPRAAESAASLGEVRSRRTAWRGRASCAGCSTG